MVLFCRDMKAIVVNDDGTEQDVMPALVERRLRPKKHTLQVTPLPIPITSSSDTPRSMSSSSSSSRAPAPKARARRDSNHIPRPPNAFILFRSAFIRSQQIPDRVEGNHSNLSKIIGHYWKTLSPQERAEWEAKAVEAQEEHRQKYPDWRFRPGPYAVGKPKIKEAGPKRTAANTPKDTPEDRESPASQSAKKKDVSEAKGRGKGKGKEKEAPSGRSVPEGRERRDSRCEKIASLIVAGKTGADLANAVEEWEGNPAISISSPSTSKLGKPPNRPGHAPSLSPPNAQHQASQSDTSTKPKPPIKGISEVPLTQIRSSPGSDGPYWWNPEGSPSVSVPSLAFLEKERTSGQRQQAATLGYEPTQGMDTWNRGFEKFGQMDDLPPDGSEVGSWACASAQGRQGLMTMIPDPCADQDNSQVSLGQVSALPEAHHPPPPGYSDLPPLSLAPHHHHHPVSTKTPHAHSAGSGISIRTSPSMPPSFFNNNQQTYQSHPPPHQHHQHQHHSQDSSSSPQLLLPPTSYSTLTGWAGEYDYDPSSAMATPALSSKTGMSSNAYQHHHQRSMSDSYSPSSSSNNAFGWQNTGTINPSHTWPDLHVGHGLGLSRAPDEWDESDAGTASSMQHYSPHASGLGNSRSTGEWSLAISSQARPIVARLAQRLADELEANPHASVDIRYFLRTGTCYGGDSWQGLYPSWRTDEVEASKLDLEPVKRNLLI
ncbi:hypothetical protein BKA70DRAFT_1427085 [Coprinopsis sp. MPI-PUGE-AT-0042]|nr:hypothetical protein BKA70DRAFT_1427085 [Coprinopsis sp. MPI-PUGE-AT-0042]